MTARQVVSQNVHALRVARGWTQAEFAERLGLGWSADTAGQAEHGRRVWTADEIAAAAFALSVPPGRLFWEADACSICHGTPPAGFVCGTCGAAS
jgi:transcriptional regulator with XRE-family HTH domain